MSGATLQELKTSLSDLIGLVDDENQALAKRHYAGLEDKTKAKSQAVSRVMQAAQMAEAELNTQGNPDAKAELLSIMDRFSKVMAENARRLKSAIQVGEGLIDALVGETQKTAGLAPGYGPGMGQQAPKTSARPATLAVNQMA